MLGNGEAQRLGRVEVDGELEARQETRAVVIKPLFADAIHVHVTVTIVNAEQQKTEKT